MKENIKGIAESYRRVGDLEGAIGLIQSRLPEKQNKKVIEDALRSFVSTVTGKTYNKCLDACAEKILAKPRTEPMFKKKSSKEREEING